MYSIHVVSFHMVIYGNSSNLQSHTIVSPFMNEANVLFCDLIRTWLLSRYKSALSN